MEEEHYDAVGSGTMIMEALRNTLGLSILELAKLLVHLSYDGVYRSKEHRTCGGGSLNLPNHVFLALSLPKNTLIGTWDYYHNIQIIWNNALMQHQVVEDLIQLIFKVMKSIGVARLELISDSE